MIITRLQMQNFRNYDYLDLRPDSGITIFYGDNAQGKTNILEAVNVLGTAKSHRTSRDREMIRFEEKEAHISLEMFRKQIPYQIDIHLKNDHPKGIAVNKVPLKKASELYGLLHIVFFSPEDLAIIKNGPKERRSFIDRELCQLDDIYLHHLISYHKILSQRNLVLKEKKYSRSASELLDVYDEQLAEEGRYIISKRRIFVKEIEPLVADKQSGLSGNTEKVTLVYEADRSEEDFLKELKRHREKDMLTKTTSCGPHRDDMAVLLNGVDLRKYGSQGQQRTAALSMKLAQIELVKEKIDDTPVLLLDDVLSEFDQKRQQYLMENIGDAQTFLTCTGVESFINRQNRTRKIYRVEKGSVTEI